MPTAKSQTKPPARPKKRTAAVLAESVAPLLISAPEAAKLSGISRASFWRLHSSAKVPRPVRVGGRTLWRQSDIEEWIRLGCPDRKAFEAARK